jgi:thiamine-monophosphate kinase
MTAKNDSDLISKNIELSFINNLLKPISNVKTSLNLEDDVACFEPRLGYDLITSSDALVSGVHFLTDASATVVARRLVASNASDIIAKGGEISGCLMVFARDPSWSDAWLVEFADALKRALDQFGMQLWGGDSVASPTGMVALTVHGWVPNGKLVRRNGARIGDDVYVTGPIGDAYLGLKAAIEQRDCPTRAAFEAPSPPLDLAPHILATAHASIDISDGLAADLDHICRASNVAMRIELRDIPLSDIGAEYAASCSGHQGVIDLITGGDDYQAAFCVPVDLRSDIETRAREAGVKLARIGTVVQADGAKMADFYDQAANKLGIERRGYSHF